jgi:hypothetical protein
MFCRFVEGLRLYALLYILLTFQKKKRFVESDRQDFSIYQFLMLKWP